MRTTRPAPLEKGTAPFGLPRPVWLLGLASLLHRHRERGDLPAAADLPDARARRRRRLARHHRGLRRGGEQPAQDHLRPAVGPLERPQADRCRRLRPLVGRPAARCRWSRRGRSCSRSGSWTAWGRASAARLATRSSRRRDAGHARAGLRLPPRDGPHGRDRGPGARVAVPARLARASTGCCLRSRSSRGRGGLDAAEGATRPARRHEECRLHAEARGPSSSERRRTGATCRVPTSWCWACCCVFTLGNSADAFLLLRLTDAGVSPALIPLLWALLHVVKAVMSVWGGIRSDVVGRRVVIGAGWIVYALVYAGFATSRRPRRWWRGSCSTASTSA